MLLDPRHRAMLNEMGVRVWAPTPQASPSAPAPLPASAGSAATATSAAPLSRTAPTLRTAPTGSPSPSTAPAPPPSIAAPTTDLTGLDWAGLRETVAQCKACGLCEQRMHTVFAHGEPGPQRVDWLIVGEAPNDAEDASGVPFSGPEQALVEAMVQSLSAMPSDASRTAPNVVKINALKCRPPAQRNPSAQELAQCRPYLWRQIALLQPRMVLAMGRLAAQALLADDLFESASQPLSTWRSKVHQVQGVPVVVTFHPSYLMRTPADKAKAWEDVCLALDHLAKHTD